MRSHKDTWVKITLDFFQDDFGKKHLIVTDYFSKFSYVYPVTSSYHFKTINYLWEPLHYRKCIPAIVMSDNGPPFKGDDFKKFSRDFDFIHVTSSPHFHQSNDFIEAMVKKVKNTYRKTDGSSHSSGKSIAPVTCNTPIATDLPSPAEILHGRPAQGAVLQRHPKCLNMRQIHQKLIKIQQNQKENFNRSHRAKDLCKCWKWMRKWGSLQTNKGQVDSPGWLGKSVKY